MTITKGDALDSAVLEVNLGAVVANWQRLRQQHQSHHVAAVVKANAYGLGVAPIATALAQAGCPYFFVATLAEAIELRRILPQHPIAVFAGVQAGEAAYFLHENLVPVLNDFSQLERWEKALAERKVERKTGSGTPVAAALHVDTGMNRLGFSIADALRFASQPERVTAAGIRLILSHLACASDPEHPMNQQQATLFQNLRQHFPQIPASLANSAGIFLDEVLDSAGIFHYELGRPGCALYGINPFDALPNPMQPVVTLSAPIVQIRTTTAEAETVGYAASVTVPKGTRIATVALGYADGWHRILSNHPRLGGYLAGQFSPLLGRISMDLVTLDVSHLPAEQCTAGMRVEFINAQQTVDVVATAAQTIGYEIFTRLGNRIKRHYVE
jgi:alanine racemase